MRKFRNIVPLLSITLCSGFIGFFTCGLVLAKVPVHKDDFDINQLAFRPGHFDALSTFARQTAGGEVETSDETLRQDSKLLIAHSLISLSLNLSKLVPHQESQLPRVPVPAGRLSILYSRLTI